MCQAVTTAPKLSTEYHPLSHSKRRKEISLLLQEREQTATVFGVPRDFRPNLLYIIRYHLSISIYTKTAPILLGAVFLNSFLLFF